MGCIQRGMVVGDSASPFTNSCFNTANDSFIQQRQYLIQQIIFAKGQQSIKFLRIPNC